MLRTVQLSSETRNQPQVQFQTTQKTNWLLLCCRRWYLLLVERLQAISTTKNICWSGRLYKVISDPAELPQNLIFSFEKASTKMSSQQQQQQNNNNNDSSFSSSNTEDYNDADERRRRIYKNRTRLGK